MPGNAARKHRLTGRIMRVIVGPGMLRFACWVRPGEPGTAAEHAAGSSLVTGSKRRPAVTVVWDIHVTGAAQVSALPPESAWEGWIPA